MVSFLKPAQHSRETLTIFWGVQLINTLLIFLHYSLCTSTFHFSIIFKLWLFTSTLPFIYIKFSENITRIGFITLTILIFLALAPLFYPLRFIYFAFAFYCIVTEIKIFKTIIELKIKQQYIYLATLIITINLGTNWMSNFNYLDLLYRGRFHFDTIWHTCLSSMYKTYGVVSLGIDGLLPTTYHTFLHKVYAGISSVSGLRVIDVFCLFHPVVAPSALFLSVYIILKTIKPHININQFLNYTVLFCVVYFFFPYRAISVSYNFFWSESMFLGITLELLTLAILFQHIENKANSTLLLFVGLSVLIPLTKSNVAVIHFICIFCITCFAWKNLKLWSTLIFLCIVYFLILNPISKAALENNNFNLEFANHIINYEKLTPRLNINSKIIKILFYLIVFYFPIFYYYLNYYKRHKFLELNFITIIISVNVFISVVFNFFFSIGFDNLYFTGSALFFTLLGIINIKGDAFNLAKPYVVVVIVGYLTFDLFRMGNINNYANYLYNRTLKSEEKPNITLINHLKTIKPKTNTVLVYKSIELEKNNITESLIPFIVSSLTETTTIGHKTQWHLYGANEYNRNYPIIIPENAEYLHLINNSKEKLK